MRMGEAHLTEGCRAYEEERLDDALRHFRSALRIARSLGYPEGAAASLFWIGFVLHSRNQTDFAEDHYRDAVAAAGEHGLCAPYLFRAGRHFEASGDRAKAQKYFCHALRLFKESSDSEGIRECTEKLRDADHLTE
jgi:tetratricopeptide (TPR) repeat protein